jgi:hypothetical protein
MSPNVTTLILLLAGLAALLLGRRLYWMFVAVVGFGAGVVLAPQFIGADSEMVILLAALAGGFIGAMLALVLQQVAVAIAGFAVGSYLAFWILGLFGIHLNSATDGMQWWLVFVIGGAIGAVLVFAIFEYALIFLSSIAGSALIVEAIRQTLAFGSSSELLVFLVLLIVGIVVQTVMLRRV